MLEGVTLPEPGGHTELALLFAQKRKNRIEFLKQALLNKTILIARLEGDQFNDQLKSYNALQYELEKEINREINIKTKDFAKDALTTFKRFKGKSVKDLLKTDTLELAGKRGQPIKIDSKKVNNWSKLDGE